MTTPLLLLGVPHRFSNEDVANEITETVALPARTSILTWQVALDDATPSSIDLALSVSIDLDGPFVAILEIDETDFILGSYINTLLPTSARFLKFTSTQAAGMKVTSSIIAKVFIA